MYGGSVLREQWQELSCVLCQREESAETGIHVEKGCLLVGAQGRREKSCGGHSGML